MLLPEMGCFYGPKVKGLQDSKQVCPLLHHKDKSPGHRTSKAAVASGAEVLKEVPRRAWFRPSSVISLDRSLYLSKLQFP